MSQAGLRMIACGVVLALGCGDDDGGRETFGPSLGSAGSTSGAPGSSTGPMIGGSSSGNVADSSGVDSSEATDASASSDGPPVQLCEYRATDYGGAMQELDVDPGSTARLSFAIPGVPAIAVGGVATLRFNSHDADHPGEEGDIFVNSGAPYPIPANVDWDNVDATGEVDVSADVIEGTNVIEFGAGTFFEGTFYRIGNVALTVPVNAETCPQGPPPDATVREVHYRDATYTQREHWVHRCDPGFDYAYTASGDEHMPTDCDGLYVAGGPRHGTAVFSFPDLTPATYEIQIRARHTENRNPQGALFVVDGEAKRIAQNDDLDFTTDVWGLKALGGDVDVVLDGTQEDQSDSVVWVRLVPQ